MTRIVNRYLYCIFQKNVPRESSSQSLSRANSYSTEPITTQPSDMVQRVPSGMNILLCHINLIYVNFFGKFDDQKVCLYFYTYYRSTSSRKI